MVLQGRLEGQAPDIDSVVYLTDCDPTALERGTLIRTRIVGARGYDLVAAPRRVGPRKTPLSEARGPERCRLRPELAPSAVLY